LHREHILISRRSGRIKFEDRPISMLALNTKSEIGRLTEDVASGPIGVLPNILVDSLGAATRLIETDWAKSEVRVLTLVAN